jgi:hypothetical protein
MTTHGVYEYAAGALCIASPFLFSFDSDGPKVLVALVGAAFLVLAVMTDSPTGLTRTLPLDSHIVLDYVMAGILIGAPFLFGFTDDTPALAFFLLLGVAQLLVSVTTQYRKPAPPA